ncbi:hypothetical protein NDA12_000101 [Ustilago hordei]|nr:hypothetical protein NDA12_000101 [Ustilago hordei]KAJ1589271.1 hypothetical protein NDA15_004001 [Ustilago hordei]UTT93218.1 hypothetical protein NDA17_000744 [Ustilago hordei]
MSNRTACVNEKHTGFKAARSPDGAVIRFQDLDSVEKCKAVAVRALQHLLEPSLAAPMYQKRRIIMSAVLAKRSSGGEVARKNQLCCSRFALTFTPARACLAHGENERRGQFANQARALIVSRASSKQFLVF